MRTQDDLRSVLGVSKKGSDTACAVAGELGLRAISIEESQKELARAVTAVHKLYAVCTNACGPGAQTLRKRGMAAVGERLLQNQEVIAVGVSFCEWNHC